MEDMEIMEKRCISAVLVYMKMSLFSPSLKKIEKNYIICETEINIIFM